MKKHLHNSLRALFLSLAVLLSLPMLAEEINGINYDLNAETKQATVVAMSSGKYSDVVAIPESVEHEGSAYSVTSIGNYAFLDCSGLTSVTIPNSVTSIGQGAFHECSGLTSVTIPNSVTSIENYAFYYCSGLTSVIIPNSVTSIGLAAFAKCPKLHDVYCYAEEVPTTSSDAFESSSIASATLHVPAGSVDSYTANAPWEDFENIVAITTEIEGINYELNGETKQATVVAKSSGKYSGEIVIPESVEYNETTYSVTSIGKEAFKFCSGLTSVTIPNNVTSIGMDAFEGCTGLTSVTIPNNVTSIGRWAFSGCSGLTSVTIPNSVNSIGLYAFSGCSGLTSVHISDIAAWCNIDFASYNSNPLYHAHHLYLNGEEVKDLVIPNSVTSIKNYAFYGCSGLTSVTIGNGVESIGNQAFFGCYGLKSVTIPNSVTSIGEKAFANCSELHDVYCYAKNVPSTESNAFEDSPIENATLHVPANAVKSYGDSWSWTSFGTITSTVEVSSVGYATLFLDYDAEIPEGIEAYIAKEVVGENLKMEKVENQECLLPAETGVIIKAEAGKYDFNLYPNANSVSVDGNLFVGSAIETEITAEDNTSYYILAAPDDNVGMYPVVLVDGAFVCKANKVYLPISSAHARIYFDFGTETRIVETENGELKTENCYDLAGRKVQGVQKGIYIVNGKKVIK